MIALFNNAWKTALENQFGRPVVTQTTGEWNQRVEVRKLAVARG